LLLERLKHHRAASAESSRAGSVSDNKNRRPSTIADHVVVHSPSHAPILAKTRHSTFSRTADCVTASLQLQVTPSAHEQKAFSDIVEDLSESSDPLPSAGSSANVLNSSVDEGVELEFTGDRDSLCSNASIFSYCTVASTGSFGSPNGGGKANSVSSSSNTDTSSISGLSRGGAFSDIASLCGSIEVSNQSVSSGSPFASFDSNVESELMWNTAIAGRQASLISCSGASTATASPPPTVVTDDSGEAGSSADYEGSQRATGIVDDIDEERRMSRSPVSFREGRRASDGLMAQAVFAFRQRLCETMKTRGCAELRVDSDGTPDSSKQLSCEENRMSPLQRDRSQQYQWGDDSERTPRVSSKRRSLPCAEVARVAPYHTERSSGDGMHAMMGGVDQGVLRTLQQQLMSYRLQHKRQLFQRHTLQPSSGPALTLYQQFQQLEIDASAQRRLPPLHELQVQHSAGTAQMLSEEMEHSPSSQTTVSSQQCGQMSVVETSSLIQSVSNTCTVSTSDTLVSAPMLTSCAAMQRCMLRQASYKLAQQQPSVLESDRLPRHQMSSDQLPLSPMFEEVSEDDDSSNIANSQQKPARPREDTMDIY
jgi:hypothetical protein